MDASTETRPPATTVAASVADLDFGDVPDAAVGAVERAFVDTVGVALAGATTGAGRIATETISRQSGSGGPATVLGIDERVSITDATFANGTAAHCLDFDDVSDAMTGHPSAVIVPAILAVAEDAGATGREAIAAYVAGFETEAALAAPLNPGHYERGWHATATFGTFGAAAAAASILGLDESAVADALNAAASTPAGLKRNFGSMAKPMHIGQAARSGVTAALLAADGFGAAADAIGGSGGFLDLYGDGSAADAHIDPPGDGESILDAGIDVKKYPCCYFTHSAIEAAATVARERDLGSDDVASVTVTASRGAEDALPYADPDTGFEARFSMEHTVAHAIAYGDVGPRAFEDDRLADPGVGTLRERVSLEVDPDLPYPSYETTVSVRTSGGTEFTRIQEIPPGYHENPLSDGELREKFEECATYALDEATAATVYGRLSSLSRESDATSVLDLF